MIDSCHGLGLGHGSRVMRVMCQLNGGSRVTKCDPLSAVNLVDSSTHRVMKKLNCELRAVARSVGISWNGETTGLRWCLKQLIDTEVF